MMGEAETLATEPCPLCHHAAHAIEGCDHGYSPHLDGMREDAAGSGCECPPWRVRPATADDPRWLTIDGPGDLRMQLRRSKNEEQWHAADEAAQKIVRLLNAGWFDSAR